MHTHFEIWIVHPDGIYAEQAARNAFQNLNALEQNLSHFIPNSDISRLNTAPVNQSIRLNDETIRCLTHAVTLNKISKGTFDITIGPLVNLWKTEGHPSEKPIREAIRCIGMKHLRIDTKENTAARICDGLQIDLGGIGKGFSVDHMAEQLKEWDIEHALIHGGASSVRAFGKPEGHQGWPVQISSPSGENILSQFVLRDEAMGASGLVKGAHIIDPRTARPVSHHRAAWVRSSSATEVDGLSTAFMILQSEQIDKIIRNGLEISAWIIDDKDMSKQFGKWKKH